MRISDWSSDVCSSDLDSKAIQSSKPVGSRFMEFGTELSGWSSEAIAHDPPQTKWQVGNQTIRLGDCLKLLEAAPPESVDVIVTSPPYNIGIAYNSYDDRRPRADYLAWLTRIDRKSTRLNSSH